MEIKTKLIELGGKEWNNHGKERVYIDSNIYNKFVLEHTGEEEGVRYGERNNKIFYDVEQNAIMRSYKGKKPETMRAF